MASKVVIHSVIARVTRCPSEITQTERKAGKLQAGAITSKMRECIKKNEKVGIDIFVLKNEHAIITDDTIEFRENDLREGTRRTFSQLPELYLRKGRLPVHTAFFKSIDKSDTIEIILHKI